jgi:hypothetical protein
MGHFPFYQAVKNTFPAIKSAGFVDIAVSTKIKLMKMFQGDIIKAEIVRNLRAEPVIKPRYKYPVYVSLPDHNLRKPTNIFCFPKI